MVLKKKREKDKWKSLDYNESKHEIRIKIVIAIRKCTCRKQRNYRKNMLKSEHD